jgi:hypothetical protein
MPGLPETIKPPLVMVSIPHKMEMDSNFFKIRSELNAENAQLVGISKLFEKVATQICNSMLQI